MQNADFEIAGLKRTAVVAWAWFVTPPVYGVKAFPTKRWGLTTGYTPSVFALLCRDRLARVLSDGALYHS